MGATEVKNESSTVPRYVVENPRVRFGTLQEPVLFKLCNPSRNENGRIYLKFWRGRWPMGVCLGEDGNPVQSCSSNDGTLIAPTPLTWVVVVKKHTVE